MNDPIVEEVRNHRMEHTRRFGGNLALIFEDLRRIQRMSGCAVVRRPSKLLARKGQVESTARGHPRETRRIPGRTATAQAPASV